jgi:hypothetical protein
MSVAYALAYHIRSGRLCRILRPDLNGGRIPEGCVKVLRYRDKHPTNGSLSHYIRNPYDARGLLTPPFFSLPRNTDLDRPYPREV